MTWDQQKAESDVREWVRKFRETPEGLVSERESWLESISDDLGYIEILIGMIPDAQMHDPSDRQDSGAEPGDSGGSDARSVRSDGFAWSIDRDCAEAHGLIRLRNSDGQIVAALNDWEPERLEQRARLMALAPEMFRLLEQIRRNDERELNHQRPRGLSMDVCAEIDAVLREVRGE